MNKLVLIWSGRVVVALLSGIGLLVLAGCSGGNQAGDKVIKVTRNIGGREGFRQHWESWKGVFEKKNPGWKMALIDLGNADGAEYYKSRIATGDLADVVQLWGLTKFLADGGNLQPLPDSYYEKVGADLPTPYRGYRYATMGGLQLQGIAINKQMWSDIGITEPPATWDEFVEGLKKLKAKGCKPLTYGGREWSAAWPLYSNIQINLYDYKPDSSKPSWNQLRDQKKVSYATDPVVRKIIENMIVLLDTFSEKGDASDGYNEEQRKFYSGRTSAWIMGCWIGGDLENNKVDFEIDYWPFPPLTKERAPAFVGSTSIQSGWAITTAAKGEKYEKAMAVMEAFYEPEPYQLFLNGEAQLAMAGKVPVAGPVSAWAPAQKFYDNMKSRSEKSARAQGCDISLDDMPPTLMQMTMSRVMQEIQAGNRDVDKLLKMLDDDWDSARKGM
ncbi:MAG: ABC transporter substrate-binding protein [bacterium]